MGKYYLLFCIVVEVICFSLFIREGLEEEDPSMGVVGFGVSFCLANLLGVIGEILFS